jgi:hypothetical protein
MERRPAASTPKLSKLLGGEQTHLARGMRELRRTQRPPRMTCLDVEMAVAKNEVLDELVVVASKAHAASRVRPETFTECVFGVHNNLREFGPRNCQARCVLV